MIRVGRVAPSPSTDRFHTGALGENIVDVVNVVRRDAVIPIMPSLKPASNYRRVRGRPAHGSPPLDSDRVGDNIPITNLECSGDHLNETSQRGVASQQGAGINNCGSPSQHTAAAVLARSRASLGKLVWAALQPQQPALVPFASLHASSNSGT